MNCRQFVSTPCPQSRDGAHMHTQSPERRRLRRDASSGEAPRRQIETMIIGMYREMPGLSLHLAQAVRLFGLPLSTCQVVLEQFVQQGILRRAHDGQYASAEGNR